MVAALSFLVTTLVTTVSNRATLSHVSLVNTRTYQTTI